MILLLLHPTNSTHWMNVKVNFLVKNIKSGILDDLGMPHHFLYVKHMYNWSCLVMLIKMNKWNTWAAIFTFSFSELCCSLGKKSLDVLTLDQCKAYLRKHSLRLSGTKAACIERIQEHWRLVVYVACMCHKLFRNIEWDKSKRCYMCTMLLISRMYEMFISNLFITNLLVRPQ